MHKYRILSRVFLIMAILVSNVMSAAVAASYVDMILGVEYKGYSAPASTAFLLLIPYGVGIAVCLVISLMFKKKAENAGERNDVYS